MRTGHSGKNWDPKCRLEESRITFKGLANIQERGLKEVLGVDRKAILKCILKK